MNRFNRRIFLWFLILFSFSLLLDYLLFTGKIYIFIHPKMVKYVIFSLVGFKILAMFQLTQVFKISRNNKIKPGYFLFLLPLILGFTAKGFDSSIVDKKSIILSKSADFNSKFEDYLQDNMKDYMEDGIVVFKDETYYETLVDIQHNLDKFKGKKVKITGCVYRDKNLNIDEFIIGRMMLACCAADAQIEGLECKWQDADVLNKGEWVNIEGTMTSIMLKDPNTNQEEEMAQIHVEKIERNQSPGSQYIYP